MRALAKVATAQNRLLERMRPASAWDPPRGARDLSPLEGRKYALLVTFRRDGRAVPTAVWFGLDAGKAYVRTERRAGKVKRIKNNGRALLAPSSFRAKPLGPAAECRARVVAPGEERTAERAIASNYGPFRRVYERFSESAGVDAVYLELAPEARA
jgi:uncharacterized protein